VDQVQILEQFAEARTLPLDPGSTGKVGGLMFRTGGGLGLKTDGDRLALGWLPHDDGIELVLASRIELVRADSQHVWALT
jgi:hypothetical protein